MNALRPYFESSIAELEVLVETQRENHAVLKMVRAELAHRDTDRSVRLRAKITAILSGLELPLRPASPAGLTQTSQTRAAATAQQPPPEPAHKPADTTKPRDEPQPMPDKSAADAFSPIVSNRMLGLIDYVIAIEKAKLKLVTDLAQHGGFHRTYDELSTLPGIAFNRVLGDGETALLTAERLTPRPPPPVVDPVLRPWVVIVDDPARPPKFRESLSAAECDAAGIALPSGATGLDLADFPALAALNAALTAYSDGAWAEWAAAEVPRRTTIALYGALFALRQLLVAPDGAPQELVCALGYAALDRGGMRLNYPLLTIPVDIELDPVSHVISLVPRAESKPGVEADPLDAMDLGSVDAWRKSALGLLETLDDDPLSPFAPATYEPILQSAAAMLDPGASYDGGGTARPRPVPRPQLCITDCFGFLQRERRATQLMADLQAFRRQVEDGETAIPAAVAALFTDPSRDVPDEDFPSYRGINSIPGTTAPDGSGDDLFFPKPYNAEQVAIAQRLAVRDGVVVQGPPGTGKTHTIANIISHYLATGRRVLVTSQKAPALKVLGEQLPPAIRPLAVSLLDSDREGLKAFRGSVDVIAQQLQFLRKADLDAEIVGLERQIDGLHRAWAANDRDFETIGRAALTAIDLDGLSIVPLDAAHEVLAAGDEATWLSDEIDTSPKFDPQMTDDDIGALRAARATIGDSLDLVGVPLPPADLLSDAEAILDAHERLQKAAAIEARIADGAIWRLADKRAETLTAAGAAEQRLKRWNDERLTLNADPHAAHLAELAQKPDDPVRGALLALRGEATALADDHSFFLTRPVTLPAGCLDDPKFRAAVADLAAGGAGLGAFAGLLARATKANLGGVRLNGATMSGQGDWSLVARHIAAAARASAFAAGWNHACIGTRWPALAASGPAAGREATTVLERLDAVEAFVTEASVLTRTLRTLLPRWPGTLHRDSDPAEILDCLRLHCEFAELETAKTTRKALSARIGVGDSPVHNDARGLVALIGAADVSNEELAAGIARCAKWIAHLYSLAPHWTTVQRITRLVTASGAPLWAQQLLATPAGATDDLCPSDWRRRWRLRRLDCWLDASEQSGGLRKLGAERVAAEADLAKTYVRAIEQRTWRALKMQASPAVLNALQAYAVAVGKIGRGTGKSANRYRKNARDAANAVKGALPCWIMPHARISESLPAEFGMFDLVIVDEASQSTLSALPALFRAKQILVVGDDKQVSPDNVGLDMIEANALAARHLSTQVPLFAAPMRQENSLYDLARVIFGADCFMLREHFRCAAPIIEFSKRQFYNNELSPLRLSKASERLDPVLIDVLVRTGYRKGKTNPPEADFIIEELKRIDTDPAFVGRSIGVTTLLGTEQAALIRKRISIELGIPFEEKYNIRVGDPAVFQGDERDIMFLSMVAAHGSATALSGLSFEQRFNVAASRARERMILVRSVTTEQLSPADQLRRALLDHFRSPFPADTASAADARTRCESGFEFDMFDALIERGYALDTQVRVGNHRIDIVVEGDEDRRLAVECDGDRWHGPDQWPADMQRQRTLERAGWRFWRCFASRFVRERQAVLDELCGLLDTMDIKPRAVDARSPNYTAYREWPLSPVEEAPTDVKQVKILHDDLPSGAVLAAPDFDDEPLIWDEAVLDAALAEQPRKGARTGEEQVQAAIIQLMSDGKVWTNAELKREIPTLVSLSAGDRQRSRSRPREEKWEELVNNALTQSGRSNSLYAKGLIKNVGLGRHRLLDGWPDPVSC
jgi:very-short-patch-repair endonuclease